MMAKRRTCLYNNQIIGIESIFTVVDGKQINIENKVEELRRLGRENKLFCPCGCGRNLRVIAGEKQLREQHFRIVNDESRLQCEYTFENDETEESINSKIVLKCWLDETIKDDNIRTRIPVSDDSNTSRKYEYSFLSNEHNLGLVYSRNIVNLEKEKIETLERHKNGKTILYFTSRNCFDLNGQYPEHFIGIMEKQGFCLGLSCDDFDYSKAKLSVIVFFKNYRGIWDEIEICSDNLRKFSINTNNELYCGDVPVFVLREQALKKCEEKYLEEKKVAEENKLRIERYKIEIENRRREQELERQRKDDHKVQIEREQKHKQIEKKEVYQESTVNTGNKTIVTDDPKPEDFVDEETKVVSKTGQRLFMCERCGKIRPVTAFSEILFIPGGKERSNRGICRECGDTLCPKCGRKLVKRNGRYGEFYGCSGYPMCKFTKPITH